MKMRGGERKSSIMSILDADQLYSALNLEDGDDFARLLERPV